MTDDRRTMAVQAFNQVWDLIDKQDRSAEEDRQMLLQACASRQLWDDIGEPMQLVTGDWQVAHVAALLGCTSLSLEFATAAFERASSSEVPLWLLASTCEGLARAHAVAGHDDERDAWVKRANSVLADVDDPEDRAVIEGQLQTIPA